MRKQFQSLFSDYARWKERAETAEAANAPLREALGEATATISRLTQEKSDLILRLNSEAFRLKAQGPCYARCSIFKLPSSASEPR